MDAENAAKQEAIDGNAHCFQMDFQAEKLQKLVKLITSKSFKYIITQYIM